MSISAKIYTHKLYPYYKLLWPYISFSGFGWFNWFPTQYMSWSKIMAHIICKDAYFLLIIILLILVGKGLSCRSVGLESSTSLHEKKFNPPTFVKSFFTVSLFLPFICPLKYQINSRMVALFESKMLYHPSPSLPGLIKQGMRCQLLPYTMRKRKKRWQNK